MPISAAHPILFFIALALTFGCRVTQPTGYDALTTAAPSVTMGLELRKPLRGRSQSWALSDGRRAIVEIRRLSGISGLGMHRIHVAFDVWIDGETAGARLSCTNDAETDAELQARFTCRSTASPTAVSLAVAPGAPGCITRDLATLGTFRDPRCWEGELVTPTTRYSVRYAHLERSKHVIHRLVWTATDGRPAAAVDSVAEWRVAVHGGEVPPADHDALLLHSLALHLWAHAIDVD